MRTSVATVTIQGMSPYSQSRQHDEPRLEGEGPDDYDRRTWMHKVNAEIVDGKSTIVIPAHAVLQLLAAAAKYSKRQIPGQGKATWTAKFTAGISLLSNVSLNIDPASVQSVAISANADGVRGSGRRVIRRFPVMPQWSATFEVYILDPIIIEPVFREMLEIGGMFVGFGRFRPEKGGTNGRFVATRIEWADNRQPMLMAA